MTHNILPIEAVAGAWEMVVCCMSIAAAMCGWMFAAR